mmetsp:Transcript_9536/g.19227  ORF Transcript_9536/g.19227 Transcript_9536/m.19227 type:complete len:137 (+) Transcript_9536:85-495(+)
MLRAPGLLREAGAALARTGTLASTGPVCRSGAASSGARAAASRLVPGSATRSFCQGQYVPPVVKYKKKKFCPECGKRVVEGETEDMRTACSRMWRKFMRLDDLHCPLFRFCTVREVEGHDQVPHLWDSMPRLKGRS